MPDPTQLLYMNLHEVFSERDPEKRRAAIERTYVEDVRFIDPEGEAVGREAPNDRAQKVLDDAPADCVGGGWPCVRESRHRRPALALRPARQSRACPGWSPRCSQPREASGLVSSSRLGARYFASEVWGADRR